MSTATRVQPAAIQVPRGAIPPMTWPYPSFPGRPWQLLNFWAKSKHKRCTTTERFPVTTKPVSGLTIWSLSVAAVATLPRGPREATGLAKLHMTGPCLLAGIRLTKFGETSRTTAPKAMELQMTAQLSKGQSRTGTDAAPTAQARPSNRLLYTFPTVLVFVCSA